MLTMTRMATLTIVSLLAGTATLSAEDSRLAPTRARMKENFVQSCIPSAKESVKGKDVADSVIQDYCTCASGFIAELPDDLVLDLVETELKKQPPSRDIRIRLLAQAEKCRPGAR